MSKTLLSGKMWTAQVPRAPLALLFVASNHLRRERREKTLIALPGAGTKAVGIFKQGHMQTYSQQEITQLLVAWSGGDESALTVLAPLVYAELHRLAHRHMRGERAGHTLQTTALVNEAYVRLIDWKNVRWQNRAHFFAVSAQLMRRILVDFARARNYEKRGGGVRLGELDEAALVADDRSTNLVALDEALKALAELDERQSRVVELRFFGGLTNDEVAEVLKVSEATVRRDWSLARAWLHRELAADRES